MARPKSTEEPKCSKCSFVGKSAHSLRVHVARSHGPKRIKAGRRVKRKAGRPRTRGVRCSICGKVTKNAHALKIHSARMHKRKGKAPRAAAGARATTRQRSLMGLALSDLVDLHDGCRAELKRRLADIVG